jgi:hypothetical protein
MVSPNGPKSAGAWALPPRLPSGRLAAGSGPASAADTGAHQRIPDDRAAVSSSTYFTGPLVFDGAADAASLIAPSETTAPMIAPAIASLRRFRDVAEGVVIGSPQVSWDWRWSRMLSQCHQITRLCKFNSMNDQRYAAVMSLKVNSGQRLPTSMGVLLRSALQRPDTVAEPGQRWNGPATSSVTPVEPSLPRCDET